MTPSFIRNEISALHIHDEMSMQSSRHIDILYVHRNSAAATVAMYSCRACIYLLYIYKVVLSAEVHVDFQLHPRANIDLATRAARMRMENRKAYRSFSRGH